VPNPALPLDTPSCADPATAAPPILTLPLDFWLAGPPVGLLWQTAGPGALRIAYARPLPEMLS